MQIMEQTQAALEALFHAQVPATESGEQERTDAEVTADQAESPRMPGVVKTEFAVHGSAIEVLCETGQVVEIAQILDRHQFMLESISGVDWLKDEQLEVVYDYTRFDQQNCRFTVRAFTPRTAPVVPTISTIFPGADWHERETFDFYGIIFEGHPDLTRILLPEDADFYPLLKDYMP